MSSKEDLEDPVDWVRAKTAAPVSRLGFGGQFPGVRKFKRKRWGRLMGRRTGSNCYHVMSRLTDGLAWFGNEEKEAMVILLWKMARFCKVKLLTYCVMGNHFHALIEVPEHEASVARFCEDLDAEGVDQGWERLLTHLGCLYSKKYVAALRAELAAYREAGREDQVEEIREAFLSRIGDLSRFVQEVKERFTKWYNKLHGRRGGIWQGRFKSVLVEGNARSGDADGGWSTALRTMAAYIDLNPVRAGLVADPSDYRWCGYAAALAGSRRARRGICCLMAGKRLDWEVDIALRYRQLLQRYGLVGQEDCGALETEHKSLRKEMPKAKQKAACKRLRVQVQKSGNEGSFSREPTGVGEEQSSTDKNFVTKSLPMFTRGVALGSRSFVEGVFQQNREKFGEQGQDGSRTSREASGLNLFSLRKIRKQE